MMHFLYERLPPKFFQTLDPRVKFSFFVLNLTLVLLSFKPLFQLACTILNVVVLKFFKISWKNLFKIWFEPLVLALVLILVKSLSLYPFSFTYQGFKEGLFLTLRVISAVSIFSFLCFTTTITEILQVLNWFKVPKLLLEIILLTYRFIFLLFEEIQVAFIAQKNRLGYTNFKTTLTSLKLLAITSFIRIYQHSNEILQNMQQRGYDFKNLVHYNFCLKLSDLAYFGLGTLLLLVLWKLL